MSDLNYVRAKFPDLDKYGYTDAEVVQWLSGTTGVDPRELAAKFGLVEPEQGDMSRGFGAAVDSTQGALYGVAGLAGAATGIDPLRDWGVRGYQQNMAEIGVNAKPTDSAEGVGGIGGAADFSQYWIGYAAPQVAEALVTGGLGAAVGKQTVKSGVKSSVGAAAKSQADLIARAGTRGYLGATAASSVGKETGSIYGDAAQQAIDEGRAIESVDLGRVVTGGLAAGALEFGSDIATAGLLKVGPAKNLMSRVQTKKAIAVPATAAGAAVAEGTTEALQSGIEQMGAGASFEDATFTDPTSFFAGAVGGGAVGAVGGAIGGAKPATTTPTAAPTPAPTAAPTVAPTVAPTAATTPAQNGGVRELLARTLMAEAGGEGYGGMIAAGAVIANRAATGRFGGDLVGVILSPGQFSAWNRKTGYAKGQGGLDMDNIRVSADAYRAADAILSGQYQDPTGGATHYYNPSVATPKWGMSAGGKWVKIGNHVFGSAGGGSGRATLTIADALGGVPTAAGSTPAQDAAADGEAEILRGAKALRMKHAKSFLSEAEFAKEQLASREAEFMDPTSEVGASFEAWKLENDIYPVNDKEEKAALKSFWKDNKPEVDPAQAKADYLAALDAHAQEMERIAAAKAAESTPRPIQQAAVIPDLTATDGGQQPAVAPQEPQIAAATDAPVGDITVVGQDQAPAQNETQPAAPSPKLGESTAIDALLAGPEPATSTDTAADATASGRLTALADEMEKLPRGKRPSANEMKVMRVLARAADNNELDTVLVGGTWNATDIAEKAGLANRQAAQTALVRLAPKIAGAIGVSVQDVKNKLAETALQRSADAGAADVADEFSVAGGSAAARREQSQKVISAGLSTAKSGDVGIASSARVQAKQQEAERKTLSAKWSKQGMSPEQIAATFAPQEETGKADPFEEKRKRLAAEAKAKHEADVWRAALRRWNQYMEPGDPQLTQIPAADRLKWRDAVEAFGEKSIDEIELRGVHDDLVSAYEFDIKREDYDEVLGTTGTGGSPTSRGSGNELPNGTKPAGSNTGPNDPRGADGQDTGGPRGSDTGRGVVADGADGQRVEDGTEGGLPRYGTSNVPSEVRDSSGPAEGREPRGAASRAAFGEIIAKLTGAPNSPRVHVFDTETDALAALSRGDIAGVDPEVLKAEKPYGWVAVKLGGVPQAHFILERIPAGGEMAAFMHEIGGHLGFDRVMDRTTRADAVNRILEWAQLTDGSNEAKIAVRAVRRLENSKLYDAPGTDRGGEILAYFLEEATLAGVQPTGQSPLAALVRKIYDAVLNALAKVGLSKGASLTMQDIINTAYGAARVALADSATVSGFTHAGGTGTSNIQMGVARDWARDNIGPETAQFMDDVGDIVRRGVRSLKFVHHIVRDNAYLAPWYAELLAAQKTRTQLEELADDVAVAAGKLSQKELDATNEFIDYSTTEQLWGYDRTVGGTVSPADPTAAARFNALSAQSQKVVKMVFDHGEAIQARKTAAIRAMGAKAFTATSKIKGPYAPKKRYGKYVAEFKSQALLDAEAEVRKNDPTTIKAAKDDVEKYRDNHDHYDVSFHPSMGAARRHVDEHRGNGLFVYAEASERTPVLRRRDGSVDAIERVLGALNADDDASLDPAAKKAFRELITGAYYRALDERNSRLSNLRRRNRAGHDKNMIRSFLLNARSEAVLLAHLEHGAKINTEMEAARNSVKAHANRRESYNDMVRHYSDSITLHETPIQDRVAALTTLYMLTTSVGYHVTNATQPIMVTIPRLAGDTGGYAQAWKALLDGYKVAVAAVRMDSSMQATVDISKAPHRYRAALKELQDRALLDVGMDSDLSRFEGFETRYKLVDKAGGVMSTVIHRLYQVARFVEAINRVSTAIAAYDVALARGKPPQEYVASVVEDTQGNFTRFDAPLLVKSLPKLTTQFRKYQIMMAWNYANAFKAMTKGDSAEVRAVGRRTLGYMLGHAAVFSGAVGVPFASTVAWAFSAIAGDGDEPEDLERTIRNVVGDNAFATLLARGVPAFIGVDMSAKVGQGGLFHPLPYANITPDENGVVSTVFNAVAGPSGALAVNFGRAASYFNQGDYLKGVEYAVPKGVRSAVETYRFATEGYTAKNGDMILDPREISVPTLLLNALGLPSAELNRIKWTRAQQYELDKWFTAESTRIRREYVAAVRDRDLSAAKAARKEWADLQNSKDRVRPFFHDAKTALRRQSLADLLRSVKTQKTREKNSRDELGLE